MKIIKCIYGIFLMFLSVVMLSSCGKNKSFESDFDKYRQPEKLILKDDARDIFTFNDTDYTVNTFGESSVHLLYSSEKYIYYFSYGSRNIYTMDKKGNCSKYRTIPYGIVKCHLYDDLILVIKDELYYLYDVEKDCVVEELGALSKNEASELYQVFEKKDDTFIFYYDGLEYSFNIWESLDKSNVSSIYKKYKDNFDVRDLRIKEGNIYFDIIYHYKMASNYSLYFTYDIETASVSFIDYYHYTVDCVWFVPNNLK